MKHFDRIDASDWELIEDETAGAEIKWWLRDNENNSWLFKSVTVKDGFRYGEDWSELIASHLARSISVPTAPIRLAHREGFDGNISQNIRPETHELQPGRVWMSSLRIPGYVPGNVRGRPGHSLTNISKALDGLLPPPNHEYPPGFTAYDAFCGLMILDAWISNRDRHDENWSVLIPLIPGEDKRLCGSYDLASSLGFNLHEEKLLRILGTPRGVQVWAERGTAHRLEHVPPSKPITLVQAAKASLELATEEGRQYWLDRIDSLDTTAATAVVARVPEMSEARRSFITELLSINAERLQNECRINA